MNEYSVYSIIHSTCGPCSSFCVAYKVNKLHFKCAVDSLFCINNTAVSRSCSCCCCVNLGKHPTHWQSPWQTSWRTHCLSVICRPSAAEPPLCWQCLSNQIIELSFHCEKWKTPHSTLHAHESQMLHVKCAFKKTELINKMNTNVIGAPKLIYSAEIEYPIINKISNLKYNIIYVFSWNFYKALYLPQSFICICYIYAGHTNIPHFKNRNTKWSVQ